VFFGAMQRNRVKHTDQGLILVPEPVHPDHPVSNALRTGAHPSDHRLPSSMAELLDRLNERSLRRKSW
jgi:hypothetical protein